MFKRQYDAGQRYTDSDAKDDIGSAYNANALARNYRQNDFDIYGGNDVYWDTSNRKTNRSNYFNQSSNHHLAVNPYSTISLAGGATNDSDTPIDSEFTTNNEDSNSVDDSVYPSDDISEDTYNVDASSSSSSSDDESSYNGKGGRNSSTRNASKRNTSYLNNRSSVNKQSNMDNNQSLTDLNNRTPNKRHRYSTNMY